MSSRVVVETLLSASDQRYVVGNHTNAHTIDSSIKHVAIMSR